MSDHAAHALHGRPRRNPGHGAHGGHGGHGGHGDHVGQFRRLFWIMLVLAVPVVGVLRRCSPMLLGYALPDGRLDHLGLAGARHRDVRLGRPAVPHRRRQRAPRPQARHDAADRLAITVAFLASWGASLGLLHHELDFWWELALLIVIMLLGHWIEMRSLAQTSSALDSLAALLPDEAERVDGDDVVDPSPRRPAGRRRRHRPPRRPRPRRRRGSSTARPTSTSR